MVELLEEPDIDRPWPLSNASASSYALRTATRMAADLGAGVSSVYTSKKACCPLTQQECNQTSVGTGRLPRQMCTVEASEEWLHL